MRSAYRYASGEPRLGSGALGFLDINFGVLGIFIVIFAIRIIMVMHQGGIRADYLISFGDTGPGIPTTVVIHSDVDDLSFTSHNPSTGSNPCLSVSGAVAELERLSQQSVRPIRLEFLIGAAEFRTYNWFSQCLSLYRTTGSGSDVRYIPVVSELRPVHSEDNIQGIVEEWRNGASAGAAE